MPADKMLKRPYKIEPYNPDWVLEFEKIKEDVEISFGSKALAIEHVGSTSVPGMSAKHCIDVLVVVKDFDGFAEEKSKMVELGYAWEDEYINPHTVLFFKERADKSKTVNIHVCPQGSFDEEQFLVGRDYLRAHPERAQMYSNLKAELSAKYPSDYPAYRDAKQPFLAETKALALVWAKGRK